MSDGYGPGSVVYHWFIVERQLMLVRYFCEGVEAGASAACEDENRCNCGDNVDDKVKCCISDK
jgi:hypothetical protein